MTAAWVGGDVRAAAISRRTLGPAAARAVAARGSMAEALAALASSPYSREIRAGQTLPSAQHAIAATTLWNLRVLAGWVPAVGVRMMRILAGWWEIANIESQLRNDFAPPRQPYFRLGSLAFDWARLATATSATELCERLAATRWGRPDDESLRTIGLTLRTSLLQWASTALPASREWIGGAAALLLARERFGGNVSLAPRPARVMASLLGGQALTASALPDLVGSLPGSARWPFVDPVAPDELWRAEGRWWSRVEADGRALLRAGESGPLPVVGAVAVLAADAWRVRAALVAAANGERGMAEFDALA